MKAIGVETMICIVSTQKPIKDIKITLRVLKTKLRIKTLNW